MLVATFCNSQVSKISNRGKNPLLISLQFSVDIFEIIVFLPHPCMIQGKGNLINGCGSNDFIDFWNFFPNFFPISLRHTAGYDQRLQATIFSFFSKFKNPVNALFFSIKNKAAGIDHCCFRIIFILRDFIAMIVKRMEHYFRINSVLITAKRYKTNLHDSYSASPVAESSSDAAESFSPL